MAVSSLTSNARQWKAIVRPAIKEDGSLWFPNRLTHQHLDQEKATMGPYLFSAQYLLQYIAPEDRRFEPEWIQPFTGTLYPAEGHHTLVVQIGDRSRGEEGSTQELQRSRSFPVQVTTTVDPGIGETKKSDYTAIVTVATDPRGVWFVIGARRFRGGANKTLDEIIREVREYSPAILAVETVAYQKALKEFLLERLRVEELYVGIRELESMRQNKTMRIEGLVPRFAARMVYLAKGLGPELERELLGWSPSKELPHDDLIDALSYQLQIAQAASPQGQRIVGGSWHDLSPEERDRIRKAQSMRSVRYINRPNAGYGEI